MSTEENESAVAGSQHSKVQKDESSSKVFSHKPADEKLAAEVHDDRVFRFRTGIRPY